MERTVKPGIVAGKSSCVAICTVDDEFLFVLELKFIRTSKLSGILLKFFFLSSMNSF